VDAEHAVLAEQWRARAAAIEADKQHRGLIGDRADRGRGEAGLPRNTGSGNDMDRGAKPTHRFAEYKRLDARDRTRAHRRKGAVHCIVGPLVDPAHFTILSQHSRRAQTTAVSLSVLRHRYSAALTFCGRPGYATWSGSSQAGSVQPFSSYSAIHWSASANI